MYRSLAVADRVYAEYLALLRGKDHKIGPDNGTTEKGNVDSVHERTGLAIFGLGRIGLIHLQNVLSLATLGVDLLYCVDPDDQQREVIRRQVLPYTQAVMLANVQADQVFSDPRVKAVIIGTPTWTHEDLVMRALKAGKAVMCEKPVAVEYESIKKCYDAAGSLPLFCAFCRRFDPSFRSMRERVQSGEIGQVHVVKTCSRDAPRPSTEYLKISGGIFHDCAVHDLDLACWMLEERPISVFAQAHAFSEDVQELGDHDTVAITLKFPSGALAIIDLSRNAQSYGYDQRVEVFGSEGMLQVGDVCPLSVSAHNGGGTTHSPLCFSFSSRYSDAYKDELLHFLKCVRGQEDIEVRATETLAVCRMASACEESLTTGAVVHMHWDRK